MPSKKISVNLHGKRKNYEKISGCDNMLVTVHQHTIFARSGHPAYQSHIARAACTNLTHWQTVTGLKICNYIALGERLRMLNIA